MCELGLACGGTHYKYTFSLGKSTHGEMQTSIGNKCLYNNLFRTTELILETSSHTLKSIRYFSDIYLFKNKAALLF